MTLASRIDGERTSPGGILCAEALAAPAPQPSGAVNPLPFLSPGVAIILDQGFRSFTTLATGLLVGRYCSVTEHGYFVLATTILLIFANVQETLLTAPLVVFLPRRRDRVARPYQLAVSTWQVVMAAIAMGVLALVGLAEHWWDPEVGAFFLVLAPVAGALLLRDFVREAFFARRRADLALFQDVPIAVLQLGILGYLAWSACLSNRTTLVVMALVSLLASVPIAASALRSRPRPTLHYLRKVGRRHLSFGRWMILARAGYWLSLAGYPLVLGLAASPEQSGIYGACQRVPLVFAPAMAGLMNYLLPKLCHDSNRGNRQAIFPSIRKATFLLILATGALTLATIVWGRPILVLWYGPGYADYADLLTIQAVGVFIHNASFCLALCFYALKRPQLDSWAYGLATVLTLPLGIAATLRWGAYGAAFGYLGGAVVVTGFRWLAFSQLKRAENEAA